MRFQTEYTCGLMNAARHAAFGKEAAEMVLKSLDGKWPKVSNAFKYKEAKLTIIVFS